MREKKRQQTLQENMEEAQRVPELQNVEPSIFIRRYKHQAPVILKGGAKTWKPSKCWSLEYLQHALEESYDKLSVLVSHDNQRFIDNPDLTSIEEFSIDDFLGHVFGIQENRRLYFRSHSMPNALYNDVVLDAQIQSLFEMISSIDGKHANGEDYEHFRKKVLKQNTMQLWIGSAGNVTPLHYDRNHGLLTQITGRKNIVLFSHEDTNSLYPYPSFSAKSHLSKLNLRDVSLERFPKFPQAQPYCCTIDRGDMLYIPPFWWHDVTSIDSCVSVTLSWDLEENENIPSPMLR